MKKTAAAAFLALFFIAIALPAVAQTTTHLPEVTPEEAGLCPDVLATIDGEVEAALQDNRMPGAVIAIGRKGKLAFLRAYGNKQVQPETIPMDVDVVFDLASITKPVAGAMSIMVLVEQGNIDIDERVAHYIPEFAANDKENVTVRHLLLHTSGVPAANHLSQYEGGIEAATANLFRSPVTGPPGTVYRYSCVGFLILGELVRKVSGQDVDQFSREHIFAPLGMTETMYILPGALRRRTAPTERRGGEWIQGDVHDPRAYGLDGIAGNAGLFSTARDLAVFCDMMLRFGCSARQDVEGAGVRILEEATVREMIAAVRVPEAEPTATRGLGWDILGGNRGDNALPEAFGHLGFTGTGLWIYPRDDLFVIFLSNRVHPDGTGNVNLIRNRVRTIAVDSIIRDTAE